MTVTLVYAFLASAFYIGASLVLKHWSDLPAWLAILTALICFLLASLTEVAVLQRARFSEVIVLIISLEVLFAFGLSRFLLGENLGLRDLMGLLLLIVGLGLLLQPAAPKGTDKGAILLAKNSPLV